MRKNIIKKFTALCVLLGATFYATPALADPWSDVGINSGGGSTDGLLDELNGWVMFFLAIGGLWIVASLIFAGAKLAAAQGNPQARSGAFIGLAMVFIGGVIIYNAWTFAGFMTDLGG